ncbi:type II toxin-antitoxin system Phd/YefM family antitoxin [Fusobacterium pseudoperiodonticum]|nr:type II toxin-antitoxin system Phd/YefM family antitoxin [Fusobacterium pseudoperiodonticum]DAY29248.1 MAG TPA: antitoxin [Caudoviricetes sp.]
MISINVNDIFDKMIGNENEIIIKRENDADDLILITAKKYNEILEELKRLKYWEEIDKRIENVKAGKGQFHELIEVDDV